MTTVEDLRFTIEEVVDRMPERCRWDIRKGELRITSPSNARHGQITVVISAMLHEYVNKHDWLAGGTKLVWLAWPRTRTVTVFASGQNERTLDADDTLDGGDVLPGFSCTVAEFG